MVAGPVLAIIPARGGSKGLPRKNLRPLGGRPLIAWTIEAAAGARLVDRVILSSDDPEIMETAAALGCEVPFRRPDDLAGDEATAVAVIRHALDRLDTYSHVVWLQPTSPLRSAADIDATIALCLERSAPAAVSLCESPKSPYWMFRIGGDRRISPLIDQRGATRQRQKLPACYVLNGAVYVGRSEWVAGHDGFIGPETVGYVMPVERSIDIDSALDLRLAEAVLAGPAK